MLLSLPKKEVDDDWDVVARKKLIGNAILGEEGYVVRDLQCSGFLVNSVPCLEYVIHSFLERMSVLGEQCLVVKLIEIKISLQLIYSGFLSKIGSKFV